MPLLRSIILIIALVAQALPVPLMAHEAVKPVCGMKCCAPGAVVCCCAAQQDAPSPAPASTPPVTGLDLIPQPLWVAWVNECFFAPVKAATSAAETLSGDHRALAAPHVRLPVLFCCILI